jgi:hypothetical protein
MKSVYNVFQCKVSSSTEALLGLSNDVFGACKEILNSYKFECIWEFVKRVELSKHGDTVDMFILISVYIKVFRFSSEL